MTELPENKEKLLRAAIELFATRGFTGTSIRDIARKMGMSISNIYHYFGNKEGLLLVILQTSAETLNVKLREVTRLNMDPLARFKLLIQTHIGFFENFQKEGKIFLVDEDHLTPEGNEVNRKLQMDVLNIYLNELNILKSLGYLRSSNLKVLAFNIFGVINWHLHWYRPEGSLSLQQAADEGVSFIMNGILKPGVEDIKGPNL
jgi:AcrR family transcriptional regulator